MFILNFIMCMFFKIYILVSESCQIWAIIYLVSRHHWYAWVVHGITTLTIQILTFAHYTMSVDEVSWLFHTHFFIVSLLGHFLLMGKGQPLKKLTLKLAPANMNIKYFALILLTSYLHHKCIQLEVWQTLILHCNNWISLMLEFHLHCWITIVMKVKSITDQSCNEDLWRFWLFLDRIDSNDMSLTAIPLL